MFVRVSWSTWGWKILFRDKFNSGPVKSTKYYKPFELVYYEVYNTLGEARKRELEIKKNSQQKEAVLKRLKIQGTK